MLGGSRENEGQAHRTSKLVQSTRMTYLPFPCRSRSKRFLLPLCVQNDFCDWNHWQREEGGYPETEPGSRTGVKLAVNEKRGEELATNQRAVTDHQCWPTATRMNFRAETLKDGGIHADDVGWGEVYIYIRYYLIFLFYLFICCYCYCFFF